jgi:PAS domain S-box-containing protein
MFAATTRPTATPRRVEIIIFVGALVTCGAAYVVLEVLEALQWSRLAAFAATFLFCFLPAIAALLRLVRSGVSIELQGKAHEIAARERDMLRTMIDSLPDFIYMKNTEAQFLLANKFCCETMGAKLEELVGKTDFDFYPREVAQAFFEDDQATIRSGEPLLSRQETVRTRDGRTLTILTTKVPVMDASGRVIGIIGIGRNITRRVEAEDRLRAAQEETAAEMRERERMAIELRLAQKLESVGRLAAGLAHEINTPIQYIGDSVHFMHSAFDELLRLFLVYRSVAHKFSEKNDEQTFKNLDELETACDFEFLREEMPRAFERTFEGVRRVANIVRAMREFAHPGENEHKPADLNHALTTTLTVAHSEYRYAATIQTAFAQIPDVVCNVSELNQVFLNLIVNSAHAIADAGHDAATGVIQIATRPVEAEVQISIADNGCGISRENLDKIFDPFFTTKEVGRGTGQGLAIARSIVVDKHGGRIEVSSELGKGTRFLICLPVQGAIRTNVAEAPAASAAVS